MAARHFIEDEVFYDPNDGFRPEPTHETFGDCGTCQGTGKLYDLETCSWCGGDGKSVLTTHGAFHRTKPVVCCEMGILCVKDTVRHISSNDKDGFSINYGRGTVLEMDHEAGRAMVWWFTTRKRTFTYFDKLIKTGR